MYLLIAAYSMLYIVFMFIAGIVAVSRRHWSYDYWEFGVAALFWPVWLPFYGFGLLCKVIYDNSK
jgi:hypothetical protein